jgi:hypothetical protein
MSNRATCALVLSIVLTVVFRPLATRGPEKSANAPKEVLVVL